MRACPMACGAEREILAAWGRVREVCVCRMRHRRHASAVKDKYDTCDVQRMVQVSTGSTALARRAGTVRGARRAARAAFLVFSAV